MDCYFPWTMSAFKFHRGSTWQQFRKTNRPLRARKTAEQRQRGYSSSVGLCCGAADMIAKSRSLHNNVEATAHTGLSIKVRTPVREAEIHRKSKTSLFTLLCPYLYGRHCTWRMVRTAYGQNQLKIHILGCFLRGSLSAAVTSENGLLSDVDTSREGRIKRNGSDSHCRSPR